VCIDTLELYDNEEDKQGLGFRVKVYIHISIDTLELYDDEEDKKRIKVVGPLDNVMLEGKFCC